LLAAVPHAFAQSRTGSQIIVPFAPGGSGDIMARMLAQYMVEKAGITAVVDNKPGASGIIGVEAARAAPADGRTLLIATTSTHAANPSLFKKLPYDPEKDFSLVGILGAGGSYMLVRPEAPYKSLADFVAQAKARPGALNYGYFNASSQVPGSLMGTFAGAELTGVPYKQVGNAITDLISGQIQVIFLDTTAGDTHVNSGQLRALAVTTPKRIAKHPEIATLAESYPGFEVTSFLGIAVASAVPEATKQALNKVINDAISSEPMRSKLESFGFAARRMSLAESVDFGRAERAKWEKYIAVAKIQPS
jgi:tripartite-type tricarboxylate transporter receptor subunit TctC